MSQAKHEFVSMFASLDDAIAFEAWVLSSPDELLPEDALDVRDRDVDATDEYWIWLAEQAEGAGVEARS